MLDPFPLPPPGALTAITGPLSSKLSLPTLPLHAHEVLFALSFYVVVGKVFAPWISNRVFPERYNALSTRTKINWDVHVVSFVQSCVICTMSLWVIFHDEERKAWRGSGVFGIDNWEQRVWGYTGATGLLQSFALAYFLWDLYMCSRYVHIFGWGMLAHAISAVTVFSFGFRPFLYFYAPVFLLYELSSPFLNIHWFCDKLDLTGSVYQAINGALLTSTFFACRLIWGSYSSILVFRDIYKALSSGYSTPQYLVDTLKDGMKAGDLSDTQAQTRAFMDVRYLPVWLGGIYLASNAVLNILNFFWFGKMVQTIRKRFDPPWGTKGIGPDVVHYQPPDPTYEKPKSIVTSVPGAPATLTGLSEEGLEVLGLGPKHSSVKDARRRAEELMGGPVDSEPVVQRGVYADGHRSIEVSGSTAVPARSTRSRRKA